MFIDADDSLNNGVLDPSWNALNPRVKSYFKFTVVRNPWDRFISGWKYLKSTRDRSVEDVLNNLPKENLINNILYDNSFKARIAYTKELSERSMAYLKVSLSMQFGTKNMLMPPNQGHDYRHIARQQYESIYDSNGQLAVDRVIFLEALDQGLNEVLPHFKSSHLIKPMHHLNQNRNNDDYRKYFNDKTLALFNSIYAKDISIWGYQFDSGPGVAPETLKNYKQMTFK